MAIFFCYWELLLHSVLENAKFGFFGFIFTMVFSICAGLLFTLICLVFRDKWLRRIIKSILIFILSLPYIVEYFIYKEFHLLYDLETMFAGAGDAAADYSQEIKDLIFCFDGISHIFLFSLLPVIVYLVVSYIYLKKMHVKKYPRKKVNYVFELPNGKQVKIKLSKRKKPTAEQKAAIAKKRNPEVVRRQRLLISGTAVLMVVLFFLNIGFIKIGKNYRDLYGSGYEFQTSTSKFGLMTGFRLDLKNLIFGGDTEISGDSELGGKEDDEPTEIVYADNVLDIDFETLKSKATSEQKTLLEYVESLTPTSQNEYTGLFKGKNLIFISAEAFSGYVIDPQITPTLYRLATKGIQVADYYQPSGAGTTGGEYHNIFGLYIGAGGKSMKNSASNYNYYTMGMQLDKLGYYGQAFHNNTYTYYDRDKTHTNLGYSAGYMGYGNGMEAYVSKHWPQSDTEMFKGTFEIYKDQQPFNIYYMSVSGHSNYTQSGNYWTRTNWSRVENLTCSDMVKGYIAAQLEFEDALTYLVSALETAGIANDTVIVISADHYPYGLCNTTDGGSTNQYLAELYGKDITDQLVMDSNRLIIWSGCLEENDPIVVDEPVSSLDVLPTLFNLFGIEYDSRFLPGRDIFSNATPLVYVSSGNAWKTDKGTYVGGKFTAAAGVTLEDEAAYVKQVKSVISNKIKYSKGVLSTDLYRLVFKDS